MNDDFEKRTILVIDDTKPIRILIWKTFEKTFNVLLEGKVSEALETVRERKGEISLIILDYEMPEMNGDEVYKNIRQCCPEVPVIILSGALSENRVKRLRFMGLKHLLSKPVNIRRLKDEIGKILNIEGL